MSKFDPPSNTHPGEPVTLDAPGVLMPLGLEGRGCDDASGSGRFKLEAAGFRVNYVAVRDAATLEPLAGPVRAPARVLAAAYLGATRLIDNMAVLPKTKGK